MVNKVLGVGHCSLDAPRLAKAVGQVNGVYINTSTVQEAMELLKKEKFALVLPNRVIGSDEKAGMHMIKAVKADPALADIPIMLVSGFADKQREAQAAGAEAGFGKADLETPAVLAMLRQYMD